MSFIACLRVICNNIFETINKIKHYNFYPILEILKGYIKYLAEKILPYVGMCH